MPLESDSRDAGQADSTPRAGGEIVSSETSFRVNDFGETVSFRSSQAIDTEASLEPGEQFEPGELAQPEAVGRYRIESILGQGGFGAVYRGFDEQLDRPVAIKVPLLNRESESAQEDFLREARQLAKLAHPGIVSVFDIGVADGRCYIVTEFLEGTDLNGWLKENQPNWQNGIGVVAEVADALAHAHALSTVHRDVKPANIIMVNRPEGIRPVLVDFGLAVSDAVSSKKQRGIVSGTPNYMSPEQALGEGHRIDGRTDVYALGVILYRILTGRLPFRSKSLGDLLEQVISDDPQPLRQLVPTLPVELEAVCLKALSKSVGDRYTTAMDFAEALRRLVQPAGEPALEATASGVEQSAVQPPIQEVDSVSEETRPSIRRSREAE